MTPEQTAKVGLPIVPRSKVDPTRSAKQVTAMYRDIEHRYLGIKRALLPPKRRAELADTAIAFNVPATWARIVRGLEIYVAHTDDAMDRDAIERRMQELRRALS